MTLWFLSIEIQQKAAQMAESKNSLAVASGASRPDGERCRYGLSHRQKKKKEGEAWHLLWQSCLFLTYCICVMMKTWHRDSYADNITQNNEKKWKHHFLHHQVRGIMGETQIFDLFGIIQWRGSSKYRIRQINVIWEQQFKQNKIKVKQF